jgi:uncharacterized protein YegP (UPF0339 family)
MTDKNGFSQFRFNTSNNARLIIAGEYYNSLASCQSALESTKKFAETDKIVTLDKIPDKEIREEILTLGSVDKREDGKVELFIDNDKKWRARLVASNGETLFVTNDYASKQGTLAGLKSIKTKVDAADFHLCRDKQNRYAFRLYTDNGQPLLVGETYSTRDAAMSAVDSVRRFIDDAKIVNTEDAKEEEEK